MTNHTLKLTDREVLDHARNGLAGHLCLQAEGYKCCTEDLLNILLGVAANRGTLEMVCSDLDLELNAETLRGYLNQQLSREDLAQLEQALNQALAEQVPKALWKQPQPVAIDFHDRPYYGKQSQATGLWVTGPLKAGTNRVYRVATAYVMRHGLRVSLAIHFVLPGEDSLQVLKALLERLRGIQFRPAVLFLDKGFDGIDELSYLSQIHQPAVIACTIRGKDGGTKALCRGKQSYLTSYTFHGRGGKAFTTDLAVCRVFTTHKRTGRMQRRGEWLIFILIHCAFSPKQAKRQYKRRFGIESSYRCAGKVRGWTTSPNPAYRFLLIALAFYLQNVWVHLRWLFTQVARRGRRKLDVQRFRLSRLAKFLVRALEQRYGCIHEIVAPDPPLP